MSAVTINLTIEKGTTFDHQFQWLDVDGVSPINMNGCTAFSEVRATVDDPTVLLSLSTTNNRLSIDTTTGTIKIHLSAVETAALEFDQAVYDLEVHFAAVNGEVPIYRICKGKIKTVKEVTRG